MKFDSSSLEKGLSLFEDKAEIAFRMYAETQAKVLEGVAKTDAPWTYLSGEARRRLMVTVEKTASGYRIRLAHGVDYGVWLELAHEKKFSTIAPSINKTAPKIMNGLNRLMERMK